MAAFADALKPMLADLDKRLVAELQLRQRVETGWARMSEPTELRPGVWLALKPDGIGVMPVAVSNDELRTGIQLRLRPVVSAGAKPKADAKAFPKANVAAAADSFEMHIPVEVEQSFVQSRLGAKSHPRHTPCPQRDRPVSRIWRAGRIGPKATCGNSFLS